jgi:hypothetical protein
LIRLSPRFPFRSISIRVRWLPGPWFGSVPPPKRRRLSSSRPVRPDPPRCCGDLQRLTARRSRSFGFPAPPSPFLPCGLDPGVFRRAAVRLVSLPVLAPLMALRSPSRTSSAFRSSVPGRCPTTFPSVLSLLPWGSSPLRRSQSGESTSRRALPGPACAGPFRVRLVAGFHPRFGPPPPFPTTLTVCSSPNPVVCFDHSRPWGSFSLLPCSRPAVPVRGPRRPCSVSSPGSEDLGSLPGDGSVAGGSRSTAGSGPPKRPFAAGRRSSHRGGWSGSGTPRALARGSRPPPDRLRGPSSGDLVRRVAPSNHRGSKLPRPVSL